MTVQPVSSQDIKANNAMIEQEEDARIAQIGYNYEVAVNDADKITELTAKMQADLQTISEDDGGDTESYTLSDEDMYDMIFDTLYDPSYNDYYDFSGYEEYCAAFTNTLMEEGHEGEIITFGVGTNKTQGGTTQHHGYWAYYDPEAEVWYVTKYPHAHDASNLQDTIDDYNACNSGTEPKGGGGVDADGNALPPDQRNYTGWGIKDYEAEIEKIDGSNAMADLIEDINGTLVSYGASISSTDNADTAAEETEDVGTYDDTTGTWTKDSYLGDLFTALYDQLEVDENTDIINLDGISSDDLSTYSSALAIAQTDELGVFTSLEDEINTDYEKYDDQLQDATVDHANACDDVAESLGTDGQDDRTDARREMHALNVMLDLLTNIVDGLNKSYEITNANGTKTQWHGVIASLQPSFTQLETVFKSVEDQINAILGDASLSDAEKSSEIMGLIVFLLGYLDIAKQTLEDQKSHQQSEMSNGAITASKITTKALVTNEKIAGIIDKMNKFAHMMHDVMIAAQVLLIVAMASAIVLTGGFAAPAIAMAMGTLVVGGADLMLSEGVFTNGHKYDASEHLAKAMGCNKVFADLTICALEAAVSMGVGYAFDKMAASFTANMVEGAVEKATASTIADESATQIEKMAAQQGARSAAERAGVRYIQKNLGTVLWDLGRSFFSSDFISGLSLAMDQAAKTGADKAVQESGTLAVENATERAGETEVSTATKTMIKEAADKAALQIVADQMSEDVTVVTKEVSKTTLSKAFTRMWITALFTSASNNVWTDAVAWACTANGHGKRSKLYQDLQIATGVFQGLLQAAVAMRYVPSGGAMGTVGNWLFFGAGVAQTAAMGMQSFSQLAEGVVLMKKADLTQKVAVNNITIDFVQMLISETDVQIDTERAAVSRQVGQDMDNTKNLAEHFEDGIEEGIKVMMAAAV